MGLASGCTRATPVYLLTVDTLRADHLSVYGYGRRTDSNLASLARDGTVFLRAYTPRAKTTPSYASLLTGTYPYRHGLNTLGQELADGNRTLAEILGKAGCRSRAFVSSTVMIGRLSNLDQGFSEWNDLMPAREQNRANFERHARQTVDAMLAAVETGGSGFWLLHLIDPHSPYRAPRPFLDAFHGGSKQPVDAGKVGRARRLSHATTVGDYVNAYDGEIAYADAQLGRLLAALRSSGVYDRALVIFSADHGESLGEHESWFRHGENLHDESLKVPLIVKPPRSSVRRLPSYWDGAVSLVDLAPTILDYVGIRVEGGFEGVSLRPILEGRGGDRDRVVFSAKPSAGADDWAAHDRLGSLIASGCERPERLEGCRVEYFDNTTDAAHLSPRRRGPGFDRLAEPLRAFIGKARGYRRPFAVRRIYRPADKDFVEKFVERHNRSAQGLSRQDRENLESLGYL